MLINKGLKPRKIIGKINHKITHTIQEGDTLWELSVKYYGDGAKYHEIIKKNPSKTFKFPSGAEGLIYPGTELEL
jgi:nucleoid-associated protein YgaU